MATKQAQGAIVKHDANNNGLAYLTTPIPADAQAVRDLRMAETAKRKRAAKIALVHALFDGKTEEYAGIFAHLNEYDIFNVCKLAAQAVAGWGYAIVLRDDGLPKMKRVTGEGNPFAKESLYMTREDRKRASEAVIRWVQEHKD